MTDLIGIRKMSCAAHRYLPPDGVGSMGLLALAHATLKLRFGGSKPYFPIYETPLTCYPAAMFANLILTGALARRPCARG